MGEWMGVEAGGGGREWGAQEGSGRVGGGGTWVWRGRALTGFPAPGHLHTFLCSLPVKTLLILRHQAKTLASQTAPSTTPSLRSPLIAEGRLASTCVSRPRAPPPPRSHPTDAEP